MTTESESVGLDLDQLRRELTHIDMPAETFMAIRTLLERLETLTVERAELRADDVRRSGRNCCESCRCDWSEWTTQF